MARSMLRRIRVASKTKLWAHGGHHGYARRQDDSAEARRGGRSWTRRRTIPKAGPAGALAGRLPASVFTAVAAWMAWPERAI
jgi:hypothetical protein